MKNLDFNCSLFIKDNDNNKFYPVDDIQFKRVKVASYDFSLKHMFNLLHNLKNQANFNKNILQDRYKETTYQVRTNNNEILIELTF